MSTVNAGPLPLHEELADDLRRRIGAGEFAPGDRLPTAKDLAADRGVHANTVLKAYRLLAAEGVLDLRRSRGATVRHTPQLQELDRLIDAVLDEAAAQQFSLGALLTHVTHRATQRP